MHARRLKGTARAAVLGVALVTGMLAGMTSKPASALTIAEIQKKGTLSVGLSDVSPPYATMNDKMEHVGLEVDLAKMIAKALGVEMKPVIVTSANRIACLLTQCADILVYGLTITPERATQVWFSTPYAINASGIIAAKDSPIKALPDLVGKKVGVIRAAFGDPVLTKAAPEGTIMHGKLPAACAARGLTGFRAVDCCFGALAQLYPDKVYAASDGGNTGLTIGGYDRELRPFIDVDLLTDDTVAAHRALRSAGFIEVGVPAAYTGVHHLRPLAWPQLPLTIELHHTLNHPDWLVPPPSRELLELTRPSVTGVEGLLGPLPAAHAVLIALHSWAHQPLRRLLDLIDIVMVLDPADRAEAGRLARRWGSHRVWRTTLSAAVSLLEEGSSALALSIWARHLAQVRERTVLENHLARWAGAGSGLPRSGVRSIGGATVLLTGAVRPRSGETWSDALSRTRLAMSDAGEPWPGVRQLQRRRGS